jgi:DNA-binding transcriptional ArsR family regulator
LFDILQYMETLAVTLALAALAQDTRLGVYRLLVEHAPEGLPAGQIAARLDVAPASLSFHLKELWRAGLIVPRQHGRFVWYRADLGAMDGLIGYLTENCCRGGDPRNRMKIPNERSHRCRRPTISSKSSAASTARQRRA